LISGDVTRRWFPLAILRPESLGNNPQDPVPFQRVRQGQAFRRHPRENSSPRDTAEKRWLFQIPANRWDNPYDYSHTTNLPIHIKLDTVARSRRRRLSGDRNLEIELFDGQPAVVTGAITPCEAEKIVNWFVNWSGRHSRLNRSKIDGCCQQR
jgi:hypothetical protein